MLFMVSTQAAIVRAAHLTGVLKTLAFLELDKDLAAAAVIIDIIGSKTFSLPCWEHRFSMKTLPS